MAVNVQPMSSGFGEGFKLGYGAVTQAHELRLKQREMRMKLDENMRKQIDETGKSFLKNFDDVIKPLAETGNVEAVKSIGEKFLQMGKANPSISLSSSYFQLPAMLDAYSARATQSTPEAAGEREGKKKGAEATAAQPAQTAAKVAEATALAPVEARKAGMVEAAQETARGKFGKMDTASWRYPDGRFAEINMRDSAAVNQAIRAGAIKVPLSVQATDMSGLGGTTSFSKKNVEELRGDLRNLQSTAGDVKAMTDAFTKTPEAIGPVGVFVEKGLSLLQSIPIIGEIAKSGGGAELTQDVTEARSSARVAIAGLLEIMSKDKRFSNQDRDEVKEALQVLQTTASEASVKGAVNTISAKLKRMEAGLLSDLELASKSDIQTPDGRKQFYMVLRQNGYNDEQAKDILARRVVEGQKGR